MNNRVIRPDAVNIETTFVQAPNSQPAVVTLQQPGQLKLLVVGGLTKAEALAGQIAGSLAHPGALSKPKPYCGKLVDEKDYATSVGDYWMKDAAQQQTEIDAAFERRIAHCALNIAEAILAESARRQQPQEQS